MSLLAALARARVLANNHQETYVVYENRDWGEIEYYYTKEDTADRGIADGWLFEDEIKMIVEPA